LLTAPTASPLQEYFAGLVPAIAAAMEFQQITHSAAVNCRVRHIIRSKLFAAFADKPPRPASGRATIV
jgi:hypothetical protein